MLLNFPRYNLESCLRCWCCCLLQESTGTASHELFMFKVFIPKMLWESELESGHCTYLQVLASNGECLRVFYKLSH